jgi:hypothetical protein
LLDPARTYLARSQPRVFQDAQWNESKTLEDYGMIPAKLDAFGDPLTAWAPPSILSHQFLNAGFRLTFTAPDNQTYKVLASANVDGPMANRRGPTNRTFPLRGG